MIRIGFCNSFYGVAKEAALMNAFLLSQFNYCALVCMCHREINYNIIDHLHEWCLRSIYNGQYSSEELLGKDKLYNFT